VGFRYHACHEAKRLGLTGWIRNADSGEVEVHAEGSPEALASFSSWLDHGPPGAFVEEVRLHHCSPQNCFLDFSVEF
jgi:acylphosphatase